MIICLMATPAIAPQAMGDGTPAPLGDVSDAYSSPAMTWPTLDHPSLASQGDMDDDGDLDLVVASATGKEILIHLTDGGVLTPGPSIALNHTPSGLDVYDVDRDGLDDIIVCYSDDTTIEWFIQASGYTTGGSKDSVAGTAAGIVVDDIDGDGYADYILPKNGGVFRIYVYINFTFTPSIGIVTDAAITSANMIVDGDFNGDGLIDFAIADSICNVHVYLNKKVDMDYPSNYTLDNVISVNVPFDMGTMHLMDSDPFDSLYIVGKDTDYTLKVCYFNGSHVSLNNSFIIGDGPAIVSFLDLDGIGAVDPLITFPLNNRTVAHTWPESGFLGQPEWSFPNEEGAIISTSIDVNQDGYKDLVLLSPGSLSTYFRSTGIGNADVDIMLGTEWSSMLVGNGNGTLIFVPEKVSPWIGVYSANGSLQWKAMTDGAPIDMVAIDLDQNGYDDLITLDSGNDTLSIFYANEFITGDVLPDDVINLLFAPGHLAFGNLSGDSRIDVAVAGDSEIRVLENVGGNLDIATNLNESLASGNISDLVCGQMNIDYDGINDQDDLIVINGSQVEILYLGPSGIQNTYIINGLPLKPIQLSTGDLDHDSEDDLSILLSNGSVRCHIQQDGYETGVINDDDYYFMLDAPSLSWISVSDMDDDGVDEVVGTDASLNVVWIMETDGQSVTSSTQLTGGAGNLTAGVGDVNGDDRPDILLASPGSSTVSVFLQVNQAPTAVALTSSMTPDEGSTVWLNASASIDTLADMATLNYTWTVGGWTSYGMLVDYTPMDSGNVTVELTVRDRDGLIGNDSLVLDVQDVFPSATFDDDGPANESEPIIFTHIPTVPGDVINWTWDFGDGTTGYGASCSHAYTDDGLYNVTLTVLDDEDNEADSSRTVEVIDIGLQAGFEHDGTLIEGAMLWFNDTSSSWPDAITNWTWDFGDGTFAYSQNVTHVFAVDGNYTINLTVTDDDDRSAWIDVALTIEDTEPVASIVIDDDTPVETVTIVLQDIGMSHDPIANRTWIIDGEEVGWSVSIEWMFLEDGDHSITLLVTDSDGSEGRDDLAVNVADLELQASFITAGGVEGDGITFQDGSSSWPDIITNWTWDFGDGNISYGQAQTHIYITSGEYLVRLTIIDDDGRTAWFNTTVTVSDSVPEAHMSVTDYGPMEGDVVTFTDVSSAYDGLASRQWYVDGDPEGQGDSMDHVFMQEGTHEVTLVVVDNDGSQSNVSVEIVVVDAGIFADFQFSIGVFEGGAIQFTDASSSWPDAITNWTWDFGDGATSHSRNPAHVFMEDSEYMVNLTVLDVDDRSASIECAVTVLNMAPVASFTTSVPVAIEITEVHFTDDSQSYDDLIEWEWFIDGVRVSTEPSMTHTFQDNGTYVISLRVIDDDGNESTTSRSFVVLDSDPLIGSFSHDGGQSTSEGDLLVFTVSASSADGIIGYSWDFGDGDNTSTLLGVVEHTYTHRGEYTVTVSVDDSDSTSEYSLCLNVVNIKPVAAFTYQVQSGGLVVFDATASSDTPGDTISLGWNFHDGGGVLGPFESRFLEHQYDGDGTYDVTLTVTDDDGRTDSLTMQVVVDLTSPIISNMTVAGGGVVGSPTIIKVQVEDEFGLASVILHYILNGTEHTTPMTLDADGNFIGQIPSVGTEQDLIYWIEAIDGSENIAVSGEMELQIREASMDPVIIALVAVILGLIITLVFILTMGKVEEVFIIYNDGRLMAHESNRLKPGMDSDIMSSMLVVIQDFVTDSFVDDEDTSLNRLRFGKKEVLIERGEHIFMAVVLKGKPPKNMGDRMQRTIRDMEQEFPLEEWDGDLDRIRGMRERSRRLFRLASLGKIVGNKGAQEL